VTSEYIRASVLKRMPNGEVASRTTAVHATPRPASRRAATHTTGSVAMPKTAESERTARSLWPNSPIQPWRRK
jgi:hypothetical protein